jgi:BASS family bile acid:Na+ symporter
VAGFLVAGRPEEQQSVVALGSAQRNLSAAIVVAAQNFGDDAEVIIMVMVVGVIGRISLFAVAGELGKRSRPAVSTAPSAPTAETRSTPAAVWVPSSCRRSTGWRSQARL